MNNLLIDLKQTIDKAVELTEMLSDDSFDDEDFTTVITDDQTNPILDKLFAIAKLVNDLPS